MKILHTSDWHLGHSFFGRRRYKEFSAFFDWLLHIIEAEHIDVLLISGDIFDTSTPGNKAISLYFSFLSNVAKSYCRHIIVVAGNHDSPTFIDAPKNILQALNVHVVGSISEDKAEQVVVLNNTHGTPELVVCAIPYLRDRDMRLVEAGESFEDKERKLYEGIKNHYAIVGEQGTALKERYGIPLVTMGHLFCAGGQVTEGDGTRELYVGSLVRTPVTVFPEQSDYVALGHLHTAQIVGGDKHIQYSGSPFPMGFDEACSGKSVIIVNLEQSGQSIDLTTTLIPVPVFQKIIRVVGQTLEEITLELTSLKQLQESVWVEVTYQGNEVVPELRKSLNEIVAGSLVEVLRIKDLQRKDALSLTLVNQESLETLSPQEVFVRCLDEHDVPEEQRSGLLHTFEEAFFAFMNNDNRAK